MTHKISDLTNTPVDKVPDHTFGSLITRRVELLKSNTINSHSGIGKIFAFAKALFRSVAFLPGSFYREADRELRIAMKLSSDIGWLIQDSTIIDIAQKSGIIVGHINDLTIKQITNAVTEEERKRKAKPSPPASAVGDVDASYIGSGGTVNYPPNP